MSVHLSVEMTFEGTPGHDTDEEFETFLDNVVDHLEKIGREADLAARITTRVADFAATIDTDSFEDAVNTFLADLRTALHAAGCVTAGWATLFRPLSRVVRELQDA